MGDGIYFGNFIFERMFKNFSRMKKIVQPGSGVDDMGGGMAEGCLKWAAGIVIGIIVIFLILRAFKII